MTILITGAAGFIGSYVARALIRQGYTVIGIDNFHEYYPQEAKEYANDLTQQEAEQYQGDWIFYEGDIRSRFFIADIFEKYDIDKVLHLAAMAGVSYSIKNPHLYMDVNIMGTTVIMDEVVKHNIGQVVFASSSSVYGERTDVPFSEQDEVNYPVSPYAASKRMGETLLWTYHYLYQIPITCLRFFTVYGPLQRPYGMVIQRFMKQMDHGEPVTIYGDGSMGRDFTYIDDIVSGILSALDTPLGYDIINLGNSQPVTVSEIVEALEEVMGVSAERHYLERPATEVSVTYADIEKARRLLGYDPQTSFKEGISRQWETYRQMPQWYKDLPW